MAAPEKSGYTIKATFTPDSGTAIAFNAKSKTPPGYEGLGPIDINTDGSPTLAEQAPADQIKLTTATVSVIQDFDLQEELRAIMLQKGSLALTSSFTSKTITFGNCWIQNVKPGSADIDGNPTMDIEIEFGGGTAGVPVIA